MRGRHPGCFRSGTDPCYSVKPQELLSFPTMKHQMNHLSPGVNCEPSLDGAEPPCGSQTLVPASDSTEFLLHQTTPLFLKKQGCPGQMQPAWAPRGLKAPLLGTTGVDHWQSVESDSLGFRFTFGLRYSLYGQVSRSETQFPHLSNGYNNST